MTGRKSARDLGRGGHVLVGSFLVRTSVAGRTVFVRAARNGEIVVALIDQARATLKRLFRFGDEVELRPSNATVQPIKVHASRVEIQGIFRGLMRPSS